MKLSNDLRQMNEEQFLEVVNLLKERTNNFKKFPVELFLKNNQFILILRIALGMTRSTFAKKIGINQETVRHVEAGRDQNKIKRSSIAKKWCKKITKFLQTGKVNFDLNKAIVLWRNLSLLQTKEDSEAQEIRKELEKLKLPQDMRKITLNQFEKLLNFVKKKTNNFSQIPISLITADSRFLFVFRCILGMSQKTLAEELGTSKDWVRHTESGRNKIVHVGPASRWIHKLEKLLNKNSIDLDEAKITFKRFKFLEMK
jgi:DNA-binding XRE family transcriptional regulator